MRDIEIPGGIEVKIEGNMIKVSGSGNVLERHFDDQVTDIIVKDNKVIVDSKYSRKKVQDLEGTYIAHIRNMINGVQRPFVYKMKVVNAHFPMNIKVHENILVVQNFLGEKFNRTVKIPGGIKVEVHGDELSIEGRNKEIVGATAGRIEKVCYKGSRDSRKFQDGIYLVSKGE